MYARVTCHGDPPHVAQGQAGGGGQPRAGAAALRAGAGEAVVAHGAASAALLPGHRGRVRARHRVRGTVTRVTAVTTGVTRPGAGGHTLQRAVEAVAGGRAWGEIGF